MTKSARCLFASLLLAALVLPLPLAEVAAQEAQFRGNERHTGEYAAEGVPALHGVRWSLPLGGQVIASPAVVADTVYAAASNGLVVAADRATGTRKWKFQIRSRIASSPAVADGLLLFAAYDGYFYALDAQTGLLKWKFQSGGEHRFSAKNLHGTQPAAEVMPDPWDSYLSSPAIANGTVYFGSGDGNVYALNLTDGKLLWKFQTGDVVHASPALDGGTVFIGSWDRNFYALDAKTGQEKWRFATGADPAIHNQEGIQSSAAVVNGTVYFGCRDSHLYAVDELTGQKKWAISTNGSWVVNSPAVSNGLVFFGTSDTSKLIAAHAENGEVAFTLDFRGWPIFASPAVAGKTLYIGTTGGALHAVDLNTHTIAWSYATRASQTTGAPFFKKDGSSDYFSAFGGGDFGFYDDIVAGYNKLLATGSILSSPVVAGKMVLFGSVDGNLYALY
jgi:outer membrane protein assembly factor BamB